MTNPVLAAAVPVLSRLADCGFEAVFVGGCVRDELVGRPITDVDIATSAKPEDVIRLFPRTLPTGLGHGTVTVIMDGATCEVTTFRKESQYEAFRRPSSVEFISELEEDLRRRDFTINAIALRPDGAIVDPYGGLNDLREGIVRCVGDADARFQEDALRLLRGIRFAAEFGADSDPVAADTWEALMKHRDLLGHVAMERVGAELDKMMSGNNPDRAFMLLFHSGLLERTKELLPLPYKLKGLDVRNMEELSNGRLLSPVGDANHRFAALFMFLDMDENMTENWLRAMRISRKRISFISSVVVFHRRWKLAAVGTDTDEKSRWIRLVITAGRETAEAWLAIMFSSSLRGAGGCKLERLRLILDGMPAASLKELAVKGSEIMMEAGKPSGPWLQQCLNVLLYETATGSVPNDRQSLLSYARHMISKERL